MRKRILAYLKYIDGILAYDIPVTSAFDIQNEPKLSAQKDVIPTRKEYELLLAHHLEQIQMFQHERLIHLLVTILFAILTFASVFVCIFNFSIPVLILTLMLLVLLVPYIMHYMLLENGVQKMYAQYDELVKRILK